MPLRNISKSFEYISKNAYLQMTVDKCADLILQTILKTSLSLAQHEMSLEGATTCQTVS